MGPMEAALRSRAAEQLSESATLELSAPQPLRAPIVPHKRTSPWPWIALALAAAGLQGCELAVLGAAGSAAYSIAQDRRTSGTQFDDETIQPRTQSRVSDRFGNKVHLTVTSFNRMALLTGEA